MEHFAKVNRDKNKSFELRPIGDRTLKASVLGDSEGIPRPAKRQRNSQTAHIDVVPVKDHHIMSCEHLDVFTPAGDRKLVGDVNFTLGHGESLLLMGPSGCGKSSILRVLGRLWPAYRAHGGAGVDPQVCRPGNRNMFFLSQKPYMIEGRRKLSYYENFVLGPKNR